MFEEIKKRHTKFRKCSSWIEKKKKFAIAQKLIGNEHYFKSFHINVLIKMLVYKHKNYPSSCSLSMLIDN